MNENEAVMFGCSTFEQIRSHTFNEFLDSLGFHGVTIVGRFSCFILTALSLARSVRFEPAVLLD